MVAAALAHVLNGFLLNFLRRVFKAGVKLGIYFRVIVKPALQFLSSQIISPMHNSNHRAGANSPTPKACLHTGANSFHKILKRYISIKIIPLRVGVFMTYILGKRLNRFLLAFLNGLNPASFKHFIGQTQ